MRTYHWPYLSGLPDVESYRRIYADLLATYTGSTVIDGGKVSSALVPFEWSPPTTSPYQAIAQLRNDRYDDAMRFGTHVTWRHGDLQDFDSCDFSDYRPPCLKIVIGVKRDNDLASMRVRAFVGVGVYSTNPIVGKMIYSPAITPEMREALSIYYQNAPSCTSNEKHRFEKALKNLGGRAVAGIRTLLEHDTALAAILTAMGQPEVAAAVKVAGSVNRSMPRKAASKPKPRKGKAKASKPK